MKQRIIFLVGQLHSSSRNLTPSTPIPPFSLPPITHNQPNLQTPQPHPLYNPQLPLNLSPHHLSKPSQSNKTQTSPQTPTSHPKRPIHPDIRGYRYTQKFRIHFRKTSGGFPGGFRALPGGASGTLPGGLPGGFREASGGVPGVQVVQVGNKPISYSKGTGLFCYNIQPQRRFYSRKLVFHQFVMHQQESASHGRRTNNYWPAVKGLCPRKH